MTDNFEALEAKIDHMEGLLEGIATSINLMASRIDVLMQECQRTGSQVQRLGVNQEAAKHASSRREQSLNTIAHEIAALKTSLEDRSG